MIQSSFSRAAEIKDTDNKTSISTTSPKPAETKIKNKKAKKAKEKIRLNVSKLKMIKDTKYVLRIYNCKKKYTVTFSSSDKNIASFSYRSSKNKKAKLVANNIGNAVITVTVKNKRRVLARLKCHIYVCPQAVSSKFPKQTFVLSVGQSQIIQPIIKPNTSAERPTYISSNPEVATVNSKGKVTAVSEGKTEITAVLSTGQSASCIVTVTEEKEPEPSPYPNTTHTISELPVS